MATGCSFEASTRCGYECPVCFEPMNNPESDKSPRMLFCNHFFCTDCLGNILTNTNIACPLCRVNTVVDGGDITNLPLYVFPQSLTQGDMDESCQYLVMSLYQELAEYKNTSAYQTQTALEENLKEAKRREEEMTKEIDQYKKMIDHMKIFRGEVLRIDTNKQTMLAEHKDEKRRLIAQAVGERETLLAEHQDEKRRLIAEAVGERETLLDEHEEEKRRLNADFNNQKQRILAEHEQKTRRLMEEKSQLEKEFKEFKQTTQIFAVLFITIFIVLIAVIIALLFNR